MNIEMWNFTLAAIVSLVGLCFFFCGIYYKLKYLDKKVDDLEESIKQKEGGKQKKKYKDSP